MLLARRGQKKPLILKGFTGRLGYYVLALIVFLYEAKSALLNLKHGGGNELRSEVLIRWKRNSGERRELAISVKKKLHLGTRLQESRAMATYSMPEFFFLDRKGR